MQWFWINAKRVSSRTFQWISSGKEFTFTNWLTGYPLSYSGYDYVVIHAVEGYSYILKYFGKWFNEEKTNTNFVVCEHEIYI